MCFKQRDALLNEIELCELNANNILLDELIKPINGRK